MISNKFESKVILPLGISASDDFDSVLQKRPSPSHIISRSRSNSVASVYADLKWDISTWHPDGKLKNLHFNMWKNYPGKDPNRDLITEDIKWIMFALIWIREGNPYGTNTLLNHMNALRGLANYANEISCTVTEILGNEKLLLSIIQNYFSAPQNRSLAVILYQLYLMPENILGFKIVGKSFILNLRKKVRKTDDTYKQTPPIPTDIYNQILSMLIKELKDWQLVEKESLKIIFDCANNKSYGRRKKLQALNAKETGTINLNLPTWEKVASKELREYLFVKGQRDSISGLTSMAATLQLVAKLAIQAFSGMREDEAVSLPYDCFETRVSGGKPHFLINGRTTKFSINPRKVKWVTNAEGLRAINVAQRIADAIYKFCAVEVNSGDESIDKHHLFISTAYFGLALTKRKIPDDSHYQIPGLKFYENKILLGRLQPEIKNVDILELEQIDEHRDWRSEENFQIGKPWHFSTHQLRRSLALYAQRSGIVTLPSLRRQLQHLTDEMTRYYAKGAQYANDIFSGTPADPLHFSFEWRATQVESERISYIANVLFSEDKLFGGHVAHIASHLLNADTIVTAKVRADTIRMFKKGQLHYRETLMGGCIRQDECDSPALDWLNLDCIGSNCKNMVGNLPKLELIVKEQENLVKNLPEESLLYRTENLNLSILVRARDKARLQKIPIT